MGRSHSSGNGETWSVGIELAHVKVCSHLTTLNLHFFPCKGKRFPLAQNSMILGFLCSHRESQGKKYNMPIAPEK